MIKWRKKSINLKLNKLIKTFSVLKNNVSSVERNRK